MRHASVFLFLFLILIPICAMLYWSVYGWPANTQTKYVVTPKQNNHFAPLGGSRR